MFGTLRSRATAAGITEPRIVVGTILLALVAGAVLQLFAPEAGDAVWAAAVVLTLVPRRVTLGSTRSRWSRWPGRSRSASTSPGRSSR